MKIDPRTIRDANWELIRGHLAGPRQAVHAWLLAHGPATTGMIAEGTGIPLLTVRPRVTELVQLGFAVCEGRNPFCWREGIYEAVPVERARAAHQAAIEAARAAGTQLALDF